MSGEGRQGDGKSLNFSYDDPRAKTARHPWTDGSPSFCAPLSWTRKPPASSSLMILKLSDKGWEGWVEAWVGWVVMPLGSTFGE